MCDGGSTDDGCQAASMDETTINAMDTVSLTTKKPVIDNTVVLSYKTTLPAMKNCFIREVACLEQDNFVVHNVFDYLYAYNIWPNKKGSIS